jgi:hypothetical protein
MFTQWHLQDMLVDLETAKIELELARGRADEAEHAANSLRVQLAASQQHNAALEAQLQSSQAKYVLLEYASCLSCKRHSRATATPGS